MVKPLLSSVKLAHLPPEWNIHVALYQNLKNSRYLRKQLIEQNKDFEYAFIDARKIFSTTQLYAAVFRAVNDQINGRLKSHNVHSEIVLSLNTANNIGDSLRKFGISDQTSSLLVVKATAASGEIIATQLQAAVEGEPVEFSNEELAKLQDLVEIRKIYKIALPSNVKGKPATLSTAEDFETDLSTMEMAILGSIALRGAT